MRKALAFVLLLWVALFSSGAWAYPPTSGIANEDKFLGQGYDQVDTEAELADAIARQAPTILVRSDITLTANHTLAAGQTYSAIPGAVITTNGHVMTFAAGSHLEDNGGQMFAAGAGEVLIYGQPVMSHWFCDDLTGATDQLANIMAAIAASSPDEDTGGHLIMSQGDYLVSAPITNIDTHYWTMEGQGRVRIIADAGFTANRGIIESIATASAVNPTRTRVAASMFNVHIKNIEFVGADQDIRGIWMTGFCLQSSIENCRFYEFHDYGILLNGSWSFTLQGNWIWGDSAASPYDGTGIGFAIASQGTNNSTEDVNAPNLHDNTVNYHEFAFDWKTGSGGTISSNHWERNLTNARIEKPNGYTYVGNYHETAGTYDAPTDHGYHLIVGHVTDSASAGWYIGGNFFNHNSATPVAQAAIKLYRVEDAFLGSNKPIRHAVGMPYELEVAYAIYAMELYVRYEDKILETVALNRATNRLHVSNTHFDYLNIDVIGNYLRTETGVAGSSNRYLRGYSASVLATGVTHSALATSANDAVGVGAATIANAAGVVVCWVFGEKTDNAAVQFIDEVVYSSTTSAAPTAVEKLNEGVAAARTYTLSGGQLQLAMASGTYDVSVHTLLGTPGNL